MPLTTATPPTVTTQGTSAAPSPAASSVSAQTSPIESSAPKTASAPPSAAASLSPPVITQADYLVRPVLRYHRLAQKMDQQGTVMISADVDENGKVISAKILKSSGFQLLDQAAEVYAGGVVFVPHMVNGRAVRHTVHFPVVYLLK
ncbi:energy transducer TonB [Lacibacterium aquatile]|uniref:Energy transducer TonB n=1 Tax=Lacibacterium aquatile TaxID=1168082 RepID=A0ABW5DM21_9PROT